MHEEKRSWKKPIARIILVALCCYMSVAALSESLAGDVIQIKPKQRELHPTDPQVIKPQLTIIEPNGGEKWQYDRYKDIRWRSLNFNSHMRIHLYRFGNDMGEIGQAHSALGRYRWKVGAAPMLINPALCGDGFQIYLLCGYADPPQYIEYSDHHFTIGMLEITAPGGEMWRLGMFKDITWDMNGISGNAVLELLKWNDEKIGGIAVVPINAGRYRWHIGSYIGGMLPSNLHDARYKIRIKTPDGKFSATSPRFVIEP